MFPMDRKPTPVTVEYDGRNGTRVRREFPDAYSARRFYTAKSRAGTNPRVVCRKFSGTSTQEPIMSKTTIDAVAKKAVEAAEAKIEGDFLRKKRAAAKANGTPKATKPAPAAKTETNGAAPKKDLRDGQVRILKALLKAGRSLTGSDLAAKAEVDPSLIGNLAGYRNAEINARPVHAQNLLNRGFVKFVQGEKDGRETTEYTITAAGRKALEKASK